MSDCPICAEPLGEAQSDIAHFQSECDKDSDVNSKVFRLSCGHAYHNACLVRHLRTHRECPTCRGVSDEGQAASALENLWNSDIPIDLDMILEINSQGQLNVHTANVTNATPVTRVPSWNALQTINNLRTRNKQVQKARRK